MKRTGTFERKTSETSILCRLNLDGTGKRRISTGIGFFDHMLEAFAVHGRFDLDLQAQGDLHVDAHHTVEDCGIVIGKCFAEGLGDFRGIERAGFFAFPMDEALALAAVDLCGRVHCRFDVKFRRAKIGELETDVIGEFFRGLAQSLRGTLHVKLPYGWNDHHKAEACFKAVSRALRMATRKVGKKVTVSSKGMLDV